MIEKRISNRKYAEIVCKKTDCRQMFTPKDRRQIYCCEQHRVDHNNDLRRTKSLPDRGLLQIYNHNEKILKKIHEKMSISKRAEAVFSLLEYEDFKVKYYTDYTVNKETGQEVMWSHHFGIEGTDAKKETFKIHFRQNLPYGEPI